MGKAHRLARANYIPRVFGFAASFAITGLLVVENSWSYWNLVFWGAYFLVYPHLVYLASRTKPGQKEIEIRAMWIDSFIIGGLTAHFHFSLWMSYVFLVAVVLNSVMVGGFRQLLRSMLLYASGILLFGLINGFNVELGAPFYIEVLAMLSLLLYVISIASTFYGQTRRLAEIRMELEEKNTVLGTTRSELVEKARKAGMADVATGVLHNIGNILSSVKVSISILHNTLRNSRIQALKKANNMLKNRIESFPVEDPKDKLLLEYYLKIEEPIYEEYERLRTQKDRLREKIDLIVDVIAAQQDYSKGDIFIEEVNLQDMAESALTLHAGSIARHDLTIEKEFEKTESVNVEKNKLMHILFNLFKNAKEAMEGQSPDDKYITMNIWQDEKSVYLSIADTGCGIKNEDINKVFSHGFTTKKKGHGFGLHSCANYMNEMNGEIRVESSGPGKGATFTLSFPKNAQKNKNALKEMEARD